MTFNEWVRLLRNNGFSLVREKGEGVDPYKLSAKPCQDCVGLPSKLILEITRRDSLRGEKAQSLDKTAYSAYISKII